MNKFDTVIGYLFYLLLFISGVVSMVDVAFGYPWYMMVPILCGTAWGILFFIKLSNNFYKELNG